MVVPRPTNIPSSEILGVDSNIRSTDLGNSLQNFTRTITVSLAGYTRRVFSNNVRGYLPMDTLDIDLDLLLNHNACSSVDHINQVNAADVSYGSFFSDYLFRNRPCLLKSVSQDWSCQHQWVTEGKPNFDWLSKKYGEAEVPVANCNERYFNSQSKCTMKLKKFLDYWQDYIQRKYPTDSDCFYMKDWHFSNENPLENVYRVPPFFASDWLNEYLLNDPKIEDDYRFVYMGPKGSWTPLHADVFSSYSWSVNIAGSKKWVFFPPGQEGMLKDRFGNLAFDVESEELTDTIKYPHNSTTANRIVLIQEVGDAIFVPSGWHHQVWNLDDTISFNHNWVNGCNIGKMWDALTQCFNSITLEISDCKSMDGWDAQCQLMLKSCFGMNHMDFFKFIATIAHSRINCLIKCDKLRVNGGWYMGLNQCYFDLTSISTLLSTMINADVLSYESKTSDIKLLVSKIDHVIQNYTR